MLWKPYPYIARFAAEGMSQGTFKVDNDTDRLQVATALGEYRSKIRKTGETEWGQRNPREGMLFSELVSGATEISAYVSVGRVGTIWWRVDHSGKDVKNWMDWKWVNLYAEGSQARCLHWQMNFSHQKCTPETALAMTRLLPDIQRLANQIALDWKSPWFRLDLFLLPDNSLKVNEISYPGHMVGTRLDDRRFDSALLLWFCALPQCVIVQMLGEVPLVGPSWSWSWSPYCTHRRTHSDAVPE